MQLQKIIIFLTLLQILSSKALIHSADSSQGPSASGFICCPDTYIFDDNTLSCICPKNTPFVDITGSCIACPLPNYFNNVTQTC